MRYEPRVIQQKPREFKQVWNELQANLCESTLMSAPDSFQIPKRPLVTENKHDSDFNQALFESLRSCFNGWETKQAFIDLDTIIALKVENMEAYAVGLARQCAVANDSQCDDLEGMGDSSPYGTNN